MGNIFLKLGKIKGETKNATFPDHLEIESLSWSGHQPGTFATGQGGTRGTPHLSDLSFSKRADLSSPDLFHYCVKGTHINEPVTVYIQKSDGQKTFTYYQIDLTGGVIVSNYSSSAGQDGYAVDSFTLNFAEIEFTYWLQAKSGGQGTKLAKKYNIPGDA